MCIDCHEHDDETIGEPALHGVLRRLPVSEPRQVEAERVEPPLVYSTAPIY